MRSECLPLCFRRFGRLVFANGRNGSYKNPPQAVVEEFEDERTGQTRARYVNKARFVGHTPAHVGSVFPGVEVPKEPPKSVLSAAAKLDQNLLIKMRKVGPPPPPVRFVRRLLIA